LSCAGRRGLRRDWQIASGNGCLTGVQKCPAPSQPPGLPHPIDDAASAATSCGGRSTVTRPTRPNTRLTREELKMTRGYSALHIMRIVINYYMVLFVQFASGVCLGRHMDWP